MRKSRTRNAIINLLVGGGLQTLYLLISFASRTVFIHILNADYLGVNGLFNNILTILSFSELGIGSAIIYNMYKPTRCGNFEEISALLNLYRKAYNLIAVIVSIIGLLIIPFLPYIIQESVDIQESLSIIYLLFLANTVSSYLFSYRKALFTADQEDYIITIIEKFTQIIFIILQLVFLYFTHNFYIYLSFQIIATLISNIIVYFCAGKKYTVIINNTQAKLQKSQTKKIMGDISALFCYKIGVISLNATDNILISKMINITVVGISSNYTMIVNALETIISKAFFGVVASIGNLNSTDNVAEKKQVFDELTTFAYWLYGFCSIELILLLNETIAIWAGTQYILPDFKSVIALVLTFYVFGSNYIASNYRQTLGYFKEARLVPAIAAVLNIIISIVLGKIWGLFGIYMGTFITRVLTFGICDPIIVYKKQFKINVFSYYIKQASFFCLTIINTIVCGYIISYISIDGILSLFIKAIIIAIIANMIYVITLLRTQSFRSLLLRFKNINILKK